jgi:hypothetical protein
VAGPHFFCYMPLRASIEGKIRSSLSLVSHNIWRKRKISDP